MTTSPSTAPDGMPQTETRRSLFRVIATDVHFWIPLAVLAGGLLLLDRLR